MIRIALICSFAVFLSGCSWLGNWSSDPDFGRKMTFELATGIDHSINGNVVESALDNSGTAALLPADYKDAYKTSINYQIGTSYALSDTLDVTAAVNYSKAKGQNLTLGSVGADAITADFDDLETYGVEIGMRKYFHNKTFAHLLSPAVSPYVGANIGVKHVESTGAVLSSAGFASIGQPAIINTEWYSDSVVPTGQLTIGAEYRANSNFSIGLETGIRYTGNLKAGDATLTGIGWEEARGKARNISIPVTLRGRFKF